jgi:hypothetical protein
MEGWGRFWGLFCPLPYILDFIDLFKIAPCGGIGKSIPTPETGLSIHFLRREIEVFGRPVKIANALSGWIVSGLESVEWADPSVHPVQKFALAGFVNRGVHAAAMEAELFNGRKRPG